tara:strand:- start:1426 stop:2274 length:849 start_codon:yes stop_codon:yes gene_type:complete
LKEKIKMRRSKIITNKVLILLVLSGLFNLFSFAFDQMVIQSELKMRELNREMKLNRVNLESLTYSLNTINDLSVEVDKASNMFWKDLSFNMWASLAFDPENNNGWVDVYDKESILNVRNSYKRKFNELVKNYNYKTNEIYKVFKENFSSGTAYEKFSHEYEYKTILKTKDLIIDENIMDDFIFEYKHTNKEEQDEVNWKIYSKIHQKISKLSYVRGDLKNLLDLTKEEYVNQFTNFYEFLDIYASNQNKINYYILFSIISQIMGILFILLLFKELLKNQKLT